MSSPDPEEDRLRALLAEAGRRPQPPEAKKQEWEALFRRELSHVVTAKRQQRRTVYAASAAALLVFAGAFLVLNPAVQQPIVVAEVMTAVDGNQSFSNGVKATLSRGSIVHAGETVRTAAEGMLALAYRDADVRLNSNTTIRFHAARIELIDGSIYVDTGMDRPQGALPVIVTTPLGSFSHVGTQFMVAVQDSIEVTAAVREGTIMLRTEDVQQHLVADEDSAEFVRISGSGEIETDRTPRYGDQWAWVVSSSPGKLIDGLPAHEVFSWIERETGLALRYASPQVAAAAASYHMGAYDEPMNPRQALKIVDATTKFHIDDSSGVELLVTRLD